MVQNMAWVLCLEGLSFPDRKFGQGAVLCTDTWNWPHNKMYLMQTPYALSDH